MPLRLNLPQDINEFSFEGILRQWHRRSAEDDGEILFDLEKVRFIDPYGMVGILEYGRHLRTLGKNLSLLAPRSNEVRTYWKRMNFFDFADRCFSMSDPGEGDGRDPRWREDSDVLLEITPIKQSLDIHNIIEQVKGRAHEILVKHLHYDGKAINGFLVSLAEVCQNVVDHSEDVGFVGIQKYRYKRKLGRNVVKIAVTDLGVGIRESLASRLEGGADMEAIELAFLHGLSRYSEVGRGHGLASIRKFVERWNGRVAIRSGTAKYSMIPSWDKGQSRVTDLTFFPGTQFNFTLPELGK